MILVVVLQVAAFVRYIKRVLLPTEEMYEYRATDSQSGICMIFVCICGGAPHRLLLPSLASGTLSPPWRSASIQSCAKAGEISISDLKHLCHDNLPVRPKRRALQHEFNGRQRKGCWKHPVPCCAWIRRKTVYFRQRSSAPGQLVQGAFPRRAC